MGKYEVNYYEKLINNKIFYLMQVTVPNNEQEDVNLISCIDPDDYDIEGYFEDECGAYFDESVAEEACFQALQDQIIKQAEFLHVDPDCLTFTRIRVSGDEEDASESD